MRRAARDSTAGWFPPGGWITPAGKFVPGGGERSLPRRRGKGLPEDAGRRDAPRAARHAGRGYPPEERGAVMPAAQSAASPAAGQTEPTAATQPAAPPPLLMGGGGPHAASPAPKPRTLEEAGELARRTLQS